MCLAIPAKVLDKKENGMAEVDILGVVREVCLDLVPRAEEGGYVLVHAGYAIEVVDERYAQETLDLIREMPDLVDADHPGMGSGAIAAG